MAGFLSGSTAMTVLTVDKPEPFSMDKLRGEAFRDEGPLGEKRFGFVGLGDKFDTENFSVALCDGELAGFSFRVDEQKPSASAVRLEVEKRIIREKETSGKKFFSRMRRKEIAESVYLEFKADAPFSSTVIDCIWDEKKKRLYASSTNKKLLEGLQISFYRAFGMSLDIFCPPDEILIPQRFQNLARGGGLLKQYEVAPMGDAVFAGEEEEDGRPVVSVKDSQSMMNHALESMDIVKIRLVARVLGALNTPFALTINQKLAISGLSFPTPEKGQEQDATFVINAAICRSAADIVEIIATASQ
ncbi:MAG: hypothetical protein OSJ28_04590 [Desulfovibrio sp.]|nr:hypothetical protein [Desulfovibrio sp.]